VEAVLQVFEGESHAQYYRDINAPETKEYNMEVAGFFDRHMGRQALLAPSPVKRGRVGEGP
jgi:epsilon-lactone hydrolase